MGKKAIQDYYPEEAAVCYGCGKSNPHGLNIKTIWDGKEGSFSFKPEEYHTAFPGFAYGGLIACLIDCHCIGVAIAASYDAEKRKPGTKPYITFVTGNLNVSYLKPAPIDSELVLNSRVKELKEKKVTVTCSVFADGIECARGEVIGIRSAWG